MSLLSLPPDYLRLHRRLPFGVYDAKRNLLVAPGCSIEEEDKLQALRARDLYVDEREAGSYAQSLQRSAQELVHKNATIEMIAAAPVLRGSQPSPTTGPSRGLARSQLTAHPDGSAGRSASLRCEGTLIERLNHLIAAYALTLRDATAEPAWLARLDSVADVLAELRAFQPDALVYLLLQRMAQSAEHYTATHGLLCALVAERVGQTLELDEPVRRSLGLAALSMDLSIATLQDSLATYGGLPRPAQAAALRNHAAQAVEILRGAGCTDVLRLDLVRHHHRADAGADLATIDTTARCTALLATIEAWATALHRRGDRPAATPVAALRATCLTPEGKLGATGAALVKSLGMYPPGCWVRLAGGELGVVYANGSRSNTPMVAVFLGQSGLPLQTPLVRDTSLAGRQVQEAVPADQVRIQVTHDRVLGLY